MKQVINHIISQLKGYYPDHELREIAYWIIEETTGLSRSQMIISDIGYRISDIGELDSIIQQLQAHVPIQYIFGHTQWMGLDLRVTPATLIPRPETAELVEWILQSVSPRVHARVLDIGTGSGCIAIAIKKHAPLWSVTGLDISEDALDIARDNALRNNVEVQWIQSDILQPEGRSTIYRALPDLQRSDLTSIIVSNPPYICEKEKKDMDSRVLDYEPHAALFVPDNDPLLFYRKISEIGYRKSEIGWVFFEINEAYGQQVCDMMRDMGYTDVELKYDMYGKPRMVRGRITR